MRRLLVLLSVFSLALGLSALGLTACGGNDKPPLTPDSVEPGLEGAEAGAVGPTTAPPTAPK